MFVMDNLQDYTINNINSLLLFFCIKIAVSISILGTVPDIIKLKKSIWIHCGLWLRVIWLYSHNPVFSFFLYPVVSSSSLPFSPLRPSDVEQMAIDWLTGNFYFVDDVDDRVFVCNKNGKTCVTLLDQELYNPKGIALDPVMGSVFASRLLDLRLPSSCFSTAQQENAVLWSGDMLTKQPGENQSTFSRHGPRRDPSFRHKYFHVGCFKFLILTICYLVVPFKRIISLFCDCL